MFLRRIVSSQGLDIEEVARPLRSLHVHKAAELWYHSRDILPSTFVTSAVVLVDVA